MKRVSPKAKKKTKANKSAAIRKMRGKYKHLDLMKELTSHGRTIDSTIGSPIEFIKVD